MTDDELKELGFILMKEIGNRRYYINTFFDFKSHIPVEYTREHLVRLIYEHGLHEGKREGKKEFIHDVKQLFKID